MLHSYRTKVQKLLQIKMQEFFNLFEYILNTLEYCSHIMLWCNPHMLLRNQLVQCSVINLCRPPQCYSQGFKSPYLEWLTDKIERKRYSVHNEHEESVHTALKRSERRDGRNCIFAFNTYDDNLQNSERNMRKFVSFI